MDLSHLSQSDWEYFHKTYPGAGLFLLRASLIGEWQHLLAYIPESLNDWQQKRLAELDQLFAKPKE